jgi:hypothetical protein
MAAVHRRELETMTQKLIDLQNQRKREAKNDMARQIKENTINKNKRETMIMRQVREMMERNKERLIKEEAMMNGEPNADLSPKSLANKIAKPIEDVKEIMDYVQN